MTQNDQQLILITDDTATDRMLVKTLLGRLPGAPYACIEASTCDEALELCRKQPPDCLLLDYTMPDMDGIVFLKKLRREGFQHIPVVLITAFGSEELAVHALKTGVQDYLRKDRLSSDALCHAIKFAVYQKQAERALHQRELDMRAKNEELTRFNNMVTHDLKSPLVTIRTFVDFLEADIQAQNTGRIETSLNHIRSAAEKMDRLIAEILNLSQIGHTRNAMVAITLQEIVREAVSMVAGRIVQLGVRIQIQDEPVALYGDRVWLAQVFQNLIDNAVKFMGGQKEPRIEIGAKEKNGETALFVRDNGMGIDLQQQVKLFDPFEKLDPSAEGTGLGLALVKRIIETHGGRIWVESEGQGRGACFWFTLPIKEVEG